MNWLSMLLQAITAAISSALASKPPAPEPPAPPPTKPAFDQIDRAEQERLARESAASVPPVSRP